MVMFLMNNFLNRVVIMITTMEGGDLIALLKPEASIQDLVVD